MKQVNDNYFFGKHCKYCKTPALMYRHIRQGLFEFLCGHPECNEKSLVKFGFYKLVKQFIMGGGR